MCYSNTLVSVVLLQHFATFWIVYGKPARMLWMPLVYKQMSTRVNRKVGGPTVCRAAMHGTDGNVYCYRQCQSCELLSNNSNTRFITNFRQPHSDVDRPWVVQVVNLRNKKGHRGHQSIRYLGPIDDPG